MQFLACSLISKLNVTSIMPCLLSHLLIDLVLFCACGGVVAGVPAKSLRQAIEKTQSNVDLKVDQDTPYGQHAF
jgi:hypothetical protein